MEDCEQSQEVRLEALRRAAQIGWDDVSSGRYTDVDEADIDAYISGLGGVTEDPKLSTDIHNSGTPPV